MAKKVKKQTKEQELETIFSRVSDKHGKSYVYNGFRLESRYFYNLSSDASSNDEEKVSLSGLVSDFETQCELEMRWTFSNERKANVLEAAKACETLINCFMDEDINTEQKEQAIKNFEEMVKRANFKTKKIEKRIFLLQVAGCMLGFALLSSVLIAGIFAVGAVVLLGVLELGGPIAGDMAFLLWTSVTGGLLGFASGIFGGGLMSTEIKRKIVKGGAEQLVPACKKFEEQETAGTVLQHSIVLQTVIVNQRDMKYRKLKDCEEALKRKNARVKQAKETQLVKKVQSSLKQNLAQNRAEKSAAELITSVFRKHQGSMQPLHNLLASYISYRADSQ